MMIRKFEEIHGYGIEMIPGQQRLGYTNTGLEDFYDVPDFLEHGGYQGSQILFYDFTDGRVLTPFPKERNVVYGSPIFSKGLYYFLQGDFNRNILTLYSFTPDSEKTTRVTELKTDDVDLYNLGLMGTGVHITSEESGGYFRCYYPERFSLPLEGNESVTLMEDGKVYIEAWIEEGWDDEHNCATDHYQYYNRLIVKDYSGRTLHDTAGSLSMDKDGTWWIS